MDKDMDESVKTNKTNAFDWLVKSIEKAMEEAEKIGLTEQDLQEAVEKLLTISQTWKNVE